MNAEKTCAQLLDSLRALASEHDREGMARYGINVTAALGVSVYAVRALAKPHRRDHALAGCLWSSGVHEARIMAAFVDDPAQVTPRQMDAWAAEFDSWDLTDQATTSLFDMTPHAWDKAREWAGRQEEFVKRGAFAMMAGLAVHDKGAPDASFIDLLGLIEREAGDDRNFVKKAVNWALRNIGKRNVALNAEAVECARRILEGAGGHDARGGAPSDRAARWVAKDALRELTSEKVTARLRSG